MAFSLIWRYVKKLVRSKMNVFTFVASLSNIVSLFGWAAEKFLDFSGKSVGVIALSVIGIIFVFALYFLIASIIEYAKLNNAQDTCVLYHRITHQLRNSVSALQDIEFKTLELIDKSGNGEFAVILENDTLRAKSILENFCARVTSSVASQIKSYFLSKGINQNIRVVIKYILPDGEDQLNWKIETLYVDHETWHNEDNRIENKNNRNHLIKDNTDFEEILLGRRKVFMCNKLNTIPSENYKNSSPDWRNRYNSTIEFMHNN